MIASLLSGFGLGLSLILAIGAQNAFVLRQGLRGEHVLAVVLTCALSETILVTSGVLGFGALVEAAPWIVPVFRYGGAAFLIGYGVRAAWSAWKGGAALTAAGQDGGLRRAVLTCLAITWLNPHVYLDTVILLGSISTQAAVPLAFGAGAVTAAWVFFASLGFGAALLRPVFARPAAWQVLDAVIAVFMWAIAAKLLID
ncbi:LysE/ArgO family amino acid transporter [Jannaschia pohangensis]|uniref:L-lysine exporter family protein LysE/ArgO n=1 Tax=Jannaschia pohangensis TaxID=390807 RepID=A0A1I3IMP8_9RHOB|nr:LysE/ArgO family amino acid transporter [Jannaschia pohangensis]SFI49192.1 L-lysine exporter family protein LysE/ArgO [Jannaschia pohangensis]